MATRKSTPKYTPGPWTIGEDHDVFATNGYGCVAQVVGVQDHPPARTEARANARLIAAAPRMLTLLCEMMQYLDRLQDHRHTSVNDMIDETGFSAQASAILRDVEG